MNSQFKIKIENKEYDLREMSIDELLDLKLLVDDKSDAIKAQLGQAKSDLVTVGLYSDPNWFRRAESAKRFFGRTSQKIQMVIRQRREQERAERQGDFEKQFIDTARRILPHDTFHQILRLTKDAIGDYS